MEESTNQSGLGRRGIVKGAAWSVPVIAAAVAAPSAAASVVEAWDVQIVGDPGTLNLVAQGFDINNIGTTEIPAGTQFQLTTTGLSLQALGDDGLLGILDGTVFGLVELGDANNATLQLDAPIPAGGGARLDFGLLSVNLLSSFTLTLLSAEPAGGTGANTDSFSCTLILCS
ncbi:hypothetical protein [Zhihengliuella flava]|uniref:Uncharacterized protein n=1 Tax=Zhihengliuella flava TaxID=1285193 RepID=A0A931DBZ6_9MICC|nr:hypothetical protein [Zhihengliuella flava]MBG6083955.1 hypothetical protein [Zhihengliuella flava]